ncbi:MAG: hypothetical protein AB1414_13090 [bacterium]
MQKNHQAFEPNFALFEQNKQIDKDKENFRSSIKFTKVQIHLFCCFTDLFSIK